MVEVGNIVKNLSSSEVVIIDKIQQLGSKFSLSFTGVNSQKRGSKILDAAQLDALELLGKVMSEVKLDAKLPKTIRLDIDKKTINEYDRNNHYTGEKFLGFTLDHRVKIDLGMDNVLLNSIVKLIGQTLRQAEIKIGYTVRDARRNKEEAQEHCLSKHRDELQGLPPQAGGEHCPARHSALFEEELL